MGTNYKLRDGERGEGGRRRMRGRESWKEREEWDMEKEIKEGDRKKSEERDMVKD